MKLTIVFMLLVCMILTSMTCRKKESETCHLNIYFWNNSNRAVYYDIMPGYPDTTIKDFYYNPTKDPLRLKVLPGERSYGPITGNCIENFFILTPRPEKFMLVVFDADVLESTPWDTVRQKYMVLKRFDLSLHDLENMDWQISYQ